MSHAYARNYVHLVFGTKERRPSIRPHIQANLWAYLGGIAREYGIDTPAIGGTEDHVHLLLVMPPKIAVATAVRVLKANSSKWMNDTGHLFGWQQGYGCFSVSSSNLQAVIDYIRDQPTHHERRSFEDEFRALLGKHGIEPTSDFLGSVHARAFAPRVSPAEAGLPISIGRRSQRSRVGLTPVSPCRAGAERSHWRYWGTGGSRVI